MGFAGIEHDQTPGRSEGSTDFPRGRLRLARIGLLELRRDERRHRAAGERCASTSNRNLRAAGQGRARI